MVFKKLDDLQSLVNKHKGRTVIWLLCHYPEHAETDERVAAAATAWKRWKLPIWIFGSSLARYSQPVEDLTKEKLVASGVAPSSIRRSSDFGNLVSLDTVQEIYNVARTAEAKGIGQVICISNPLQLLQVNALLPKDEVEWVYLATTLRDWRWWYVSARFFLIPLAYLGMGQKFVPLKFVRHARASWAVWPF
jgi:hypothetical protein